MTGKHRSRAVWGALGLLAAAAAALAVVWAARGLSQQSSAGGENPTELADSLLINVQRFRNQLLQLGMDDRHRVQSRTTLAPDGTREELAFEAFPEDEGSLDLHSQLTQQVHKVQVNHPGAELIDREEWRFDWNQHSIHAIRTGYHFEIIRAGVASPTLAFVELILWTDGSRVRMVRLSGPLDSREHRVEQALKLMEQVDWLFEGPE